MTFPLKYAKEKCWEARVAFVALLSTAVRSAAIRRRLIWA